MKRKPAAVKTGIWCSQFALLPVFACRKTTGIPLPPVSVYQMRTPGRSAYFCANKEEGRNQKRHRTHMSIVPFAPLVVSVFTSVWRSIPNRIGPEFVYLGFTNTAM